MQQPVTSDWEQYLQVSAEAEKVLDRYRELQTLADELLNQLHIQTGLK